MDIKLWVATKAFIVHNGRVLLLRESTKYSDGTNAGRFDIPGGRVHLGERFDESLKREIREETGLEIVLKEPFFVNEWRPIVRGEQWQVVGVFFICEASTDQVALSTDHDEFQWIYPQKHAEFNLIDNLKPAFAAFLQHLTAQT